MGNKYSTWGVCVCDHTMDVFGVVLWGEKGGGGGWRLHVCVYRLLYGCVNAYTTLKVNTHTHTHTYE